MIMIYKRVTYINFSIGKRMKRMILIVLGIGSLLVFSGCVEPDFNANNKMMVFVEGEPYMVPRNANHMSKAMNTEDVKEINKMGLNCKKGDILWVAYAAKSLLVEHGRKTGEIKRAYVKAKKKGLTGCASPLSDQEYKSHLN